MSNILKVIIFSFLSFLVSCTTIEKERSSNIKEKIYYSSSGFALIYDNSFYDQDIINKKINNEKIVAFHSILKKDIQKIQYDIEKLRANTDNNITKLRTDTDNNIEKLRLSTQKDISESTKKIIFSIMGLLIAQTIAVISL